jgi:serine protease Do
VQEHTPAVTRAPKLTAARGVLVGDVTPDGPAARAGVQRGDVITAIDGKPVDDIGHFRNLIAGTPPGTRVRLTIERDGRDRTLDVAIDALPERTPVAAPARLRPDPLGLSIADLTPEVAKKLGLRPGLKGVVVADVLPGGLAAEAGLRPGDVIQEVNRRPVRSAREFARAVEQARDQDLVLLVNRGASTAYVVIERGA